MRYVYVVEAGEDHEGSTILRVFNRLIYAVEWAKREHPPEDDWEATEDSDYLFNATRGCDYVRVAKHRLEVSCPK